MALAWGALGALSALLAACATAPEKPRTTGLQLRAVRFADLAGWRVDRQDRALVAFARSCPRLRGAWRAPCRALRAVPRGDPRAARAFFERWFRPYVVLNDGGAGLFTGYYEPVLRGSRRRSARYRVPLHARPGDLDRRNPYPSRAAILRPPLRDRLPVLLWLDDPVDAFTLHIQGSGRIRLAEGGVTRVGVAGTNRRRYVSIGRILLREGKLARGQASMQGIRAWLRAHPVEARAIMNRNPRYIFFREMSGPGPVGAQGVPLTPGRSLAVDPRFVRYGTPVWIDTTWPAPRGGPLRRLVIAQDKGGAIKGAVRGDLFVGAGARALAIAGRMRQRGRTVVLLPRAGRIASR